MTSFAEEQFWRSLALRVNEALRAEPDRTIRFLWIDDILPPETQPADGQAVLRTSAWMTDGRSQDLWTTDLVFNDAAMAAFRAGDWEGLLSSFDHGDWLGIDKATTHIEIALSL